MALKTKNILFTLFYLSSFASVALAANTKISLDPSQSPVEFTAVGHPSMIHIKGKDAQAKGSLQQLGQNLTGDLVVDLEQFHTGIDFRDKHMREKYLETPKEGNKLALLKIIKFELPGVILQNGGDQKAIPFSGKLKLHGVEKPVQGTADISIHDQKIQGISSFTIKLSDYNIAIPSFAGVTVAEDVQIDVHFTGKVDN